MDWLGRARDLDDRHLAAEHQPETLRYSRARAKLRYLVNQGQQIGERSVQDRPSEVEIAVWSPPDQGRYGCSSCFRIYHRRKIPTFAVLFCFYDGTENSPGFRSVGSARAYAESEGFSGGEHD